jgi:hypothetical protein
VKPKGGRTYYCAPLTDTAQNIVAYGKKRSAKDWAKELGLKKLVRLAIDNEQNERFSR